MPYEEKKKHINYTETPLVSVITPSYNSAAFLSECIQSVLQQTYTHWEQIIVDDASTDTSVEIAQNLADKDARIKVIQLSENKGAAFCRNKATETAQGDYIAFLDSDDLWHPEKLAKQIALMEKQRTSVCFSSYVHIDEAGNPLKKRVVALPSLSYQKQHTYNYIGNLTGIYHARSLGKIFSPNIRKRQDWAVWLEAIKKSGQVAVGIQEDLAFYRVRKGSMSSSKVKLVKYNFQFYRNYLKYSWGKSVVCLLRFFWEYFLVRPKYIKKL